MEDCAFNIGNVIRDSELKMNWNPTKCHEL